MPGIRRSLLAFLSLFVAAPVAAADFDNVLIIVADDLGSDKVSSYAGDVSNPTESRPSTPNIDRLAAAGVRFSDAWAMPMCSPTRSALHSGEYAYRTGIGNVIAEGSTTKLPLSPATLPQLAADAGLATALFGKWHVGETTTTPHSATATALDYKEYPVQAGYSSFQGNMTGEVTSYTNWLYTVSVADSAKSTGYSTTATTVTASATDRTTDDAESWMAAQVAAGKRFMAVVTYHQPHATRSATNAWTWMDAASSCGTTGSTTETAAFKVAAQCLDTEIAELLAGTPNLDKTLVIFMGDNGSELAVAEGNFADTRGKSTVYESGVRVPFIVADGAAVKASLDNGGTLPAGGNYKFSAGARSASAASIVDVYATVADYLSLSSGTCTPGNTCARDSVSLRGALGGTATRASTWTETFTKASNGKYTGSAAVRSGNYKLVVQVKSSTNPCRKYELYNLSTDRWEKTNLYSATAPTAEQTALVALLGTHATAMASSTVNWLPSKACR